VTCLVPAPGGNATASEWFLRPPSRAEWLARARDEPWSAPGRSGPTRAKTVLIIDANPFMIGSEFHPDAVYRIHIDNDGDVEDEAPWPFMRNDAEAHFALAVGDRSTASRTRPDRSRHASTEVSASSDDDGQYVGWHAGPQPVGSERT
jgi:hypothetical protein